MLLLLALALQDPLTADDIEARETAALHLLRGGEGALPGLRSRLAEAQDPELRARLKDVVGRLETDIRRRDFGGGNEVGGLRARLRPLEKPVDGRLPYRLEIMNVDAAARPLLPPMVLNRSLPGWSASRSSAHGMLTVKRLSGASETLIRGSYSCGGGPRGAIVLLRPGETRSLELPAEERLTPGTYEASLTYYAKRLLGADEDLVSDVVRFEIKD